MNDEHREGNSGSGWSSRNAGASTATAEAVDRRWFEEALRAQGFLVEAPPSDAEPQWPDAVDAEPSVLTGGLDDEPLAVEVEDVLAVDAVAALDVAPTDELALAEAEAVLESAPLTIETELPVEPWDLPSRTSSWAPVDPIRPEQTPWPVIGTPPATLAPPAAIAAIQQPIVSSTRQAIAPTTLPPDVSPVPTAALAARLSRTSGPRTGTGAYTSLAAATPAPTVEAPATTSATTVTADRWTLPALQADLAAERAGGTESSADRSQSIAASASAAAEPAIVEPETLSAIVEPAITEPETLSAIAEPAIVEPETLSAIAEPAIAEPAITEPETLSAIAEPAITEPVSIAVEPSVTDTHGTAVFEAATATSMIGSAEEVAAPQAAEATAPVQPAAAQAEATVVPVQPAAPFSPPTTGIAAIERRPTTQTVGTTVDDGESDLWGLVGDPAKPSSATGVAPAAKSSSRTTALLTIFVAIVVVALVLGFIYLFTSLL